MSDSPDTIPQPLRHALYYVGLTVSLALFVVTAAVGSGLISGDLIAKWVAFLGSLTGIGGFGMAAAYSKPPADDGEDAGAVNLMTVLIVLGIIVLAILVIKWVDVSIR